jgi:hypothetical protein
MFLMDICGEEEMTLGPREDEGGRDDVGTQQDSSHPFPSRRHSWEMALKFFRIADLLPALETLYFVHALCIILLEAFSNTSLLSFGGGRCKESYI